MMNWPSWAIGVVALLLSAITMWRSMRKDIRTEDRELATTVAAQNERLALLEMKMGVFWRLVEEQLSGMLKRPTHLEMDELLDKLAAHTLTLEECYRLRGWLQHVYLSEEPTATPPYNRSKRIVAILVVAALNSLIKDLEHRV